MADFIVGYPPECTVAGNVVTFPVGTWDQGVMRIFATTSNYLTDIDNTASSQIASVGGEQSDGSYQITVTDASGFTTGNRIGISRQSAVNYYTTPTLAEAAMSGGDSMLIWYSSAAYNPTHVYSVNTGLTTTTGINLYGMTRNICIRSTDNRSVYELGDVSNDVTIYCLYLYGDAFCIELTGTNGITVTVDRCHCEGGGTTFQIATAVDSFVLQNSFAENATSFGYNSTADTVVNLYYSTFRLHPSRGIDCDNRSNLTTRGVLSMNNGSSDWQATANGDHDYNASSDGTAPGANSIINLDFQSADFHEAKYGIIGLTPSSTSNLVAGTPVSGITEDFWGNPRDAVTPTIGACECCWPVDFPAAGDVRDTATADYVPGTYEPALVADVKLGVTYGEDGTEFTGTYQAGGTPPAAATMTIKDNQDGSTATATITGSASGTTENRIYTALRGTSTWNLQDTVTGNGSATLTLATGEYWAVTVPVDTGVLGVPGGPVYFYVSSTRARMERLRDRAALMAFRQCERSLAGIVLEYYATPDATPVDVKAIMGQTDHVTSLMGGATDLRSFSCEVPRQTGFPPARLKVGQLLKYDGKLFSIVSWTGSVENEVMSPTFTFECERYDQQQVEFDTYE